MKITKAEKIWVIVTSLCILVYQLPGVPKLGDVDGFFIHFLISIPLLWLTGYIGMNRIYRIYQIREEESVDD